MINCDMKHVKETGVQVCFALVYLYTCVKKKIIAMTRGRMYTIKLALNLKDFFYWKSVTEFVLCKFS